MAYDRNFRNFPDDTTDWAQEPSAMPVVSPDVAGTDDRWTSSQDEFTVAIASSAVRVTGDEVRTRYKTQFPCERP